MASKSAVDGLLSWARPLSGISAAQGAQCARRPSRTNIIPTTLGARGSSGAPRRGSAQLLARVHRN
eukprot:12562800-Alexandrium_andersonii.AAC.1